MSRLALLALPVLLTASSAPARSLTDSWPLLAFDRQDQCELQITGNGKFMQIAVKGMVPGTRAGFAMTNARMKPIAWNVLADSSGNWSTIYLPLLWGESDGTIRTQHSGGTVAVKLDSAGCTLSASAPWTREVRVIP